MFLHWAPMQRACLHFALRYTHKTSQESSLLPSEKFQLPQPLLEWQMLQSLIHLCGLLLDLLPYVYLELESHRLDIVLQVWSHQCWAERKVHFPQAADNAPLNAAQDAADFLAVRVNCCLIFSLALEKTWCSLLSTGQPPARPGTWCYSYPVQDSVLPFTELNQVPVSTDLQPLQVPLKGSIINWSINHSSDLYHLHIICKLTEGALCPTILALNGDTKYLAPVSMLGTHH